MHRMESVLEGEAHCNFKQIYVFFIIHLRYFVLPETLTCVLYVQVNVAAVIFLSICLSFYCCLFFFFFLPPISLSSESCAGTVSRTLIVRA